MADAKAGEPCSALGPLCSVAPLGAAELKRHRVSLRRSTPSFPPASRQSAGLVEIDTALVTRVTTPNTPAAPVAKTSAFSRRQYGSAVATQAVAGRSRPIVARCDFGRILKALDEGRWHAEGGYSHDKRRIGSAPTARGQTSQVRDLVLRVLTHDLMLLAGTASAFQRSARPSERNVPASKWQSGTASSCTWM